MPVILPESAHQTWLLPGEQNPVDLSALLAPYPADEMLAYPVSTLVNSPANDLPATILPAS
jgi:putative SOS response-associated peptidase YedK